MPEPVRDSVVRVPFVQATKRFVAETAVARRADLSRTFGREVMVMSGGGGMNVGLGVGE